MQTQAIEDPKGVTKSHKSNQNRQQTTTNTIAELANHIIDKQEQKHNTEILYLDLRTRI